MQETNSTAAWSSQLSSCHLPRWEELPDIELYMDQVISQLDKYLAPFRALGEVHIVTASMINNYVKLRLLPAPVKKRYARTHLAYLVVVCLLKQVLSIPEVKQLVSDSLGNRSDEELPAAYDAFCTAQEAAFAQMMERAATPPDDASLAGAGLAMEMAAFAGAAKAVAQRLIADAPDAARH